MHCNVGVVQRSLGRERGGPQLSVKPADGIAARGPRLCKRTCCRHELLLRIANTGHALLAAADAALEPLRCNAAGDRCCHATAVRRGHDWFFIGGRGGWIGLNSVSVPIDGFPAYYLHHAALPFSCGVSSAWRSDPGMPASLRGGG